MLKDAQENYFHQIEEVLAVYIDICYYTTFYKLFKRAFMFLGAIGRA